MTAEMTRDERARPDRPASPVEGMSDWRDENLELKARDTVRWLASIDDDDLEAKALEPLEDATVKVVAAFAELADIDADWRSQARGRWFRWGLAEIAAERSAVREYRTLLEQAKGRANRMIRERNRRRNQEAAEARALEREADRRERRALHEAQRMTARDTFTGDAELVARRKAVMEAVHALLDGPAEDWDPESTTGLALRAAVALHDRRRDQLRAELGQRVDRGDREGQR